MKTFFDRLIGLLYPPKCLFCNKPLASTMTICSECSVYRNQNICPICSNCYTSCNCNFYFKKVIAPFSYSGKVKSAVVRLKIDPNKNLAKGFAQHMVACYHPPITNTIIVPIPINDTIKKDRGYNQSELLAKEVSTILTLPLKTNILSRSADSLSQHSLTYNMRWINAYHSYQLKNDINLAQSNVILVDDVSTTGATLNACSKALKAANCGTIIALCAAATSLRKS